MGRASGIIRRHVFPNSISNIVTVATFSVADAILFLSAWLPGLGIQAPQTDWARCSRPARHNPRTASVGDLPLALVFILVVVSIKLHR